MENTDFDWLNGDWDSNLEVPISNSPRAGIVAEQRASQAAEQVDNQVANMHYHFSDSVVGKGTSIMTRIILYVSTMTFDGGCTRGYSVSMPEILLDIRTHDQELTENEVLEGELWLDGVTNFK